MSRFDVSSDIFQNEEALMEDWVPDDLPEREAELDNIAFAFKPAVRGETTPHNLFIYGKSGQGKTAATEVVLRELDEKFGELDKELTVIKTSLKDVNTAYQAVGEILTHVEPQTSSRPKGLSLGDLNKRLFDALDDIGGYVVIILDEIDNLGTDDDLLYQIPRARSNGRLESARVSVVGISNDLKFRDKLSAKVKDTLCDVEVQFNPYDATQLRTILRQREAIGFQDGVIDGDVIPLCAAYAAQDQGSARQAIRFLHRAGELTSDDGSSSVTTEHLERARENIEQEHVISNLSNLTTQDQATLLALAALEASGDAPARTKTIYAVYKRITAASGIETLTSRSVRDKLTNLDTYSMVIATEKSGGLEGGKYFECELNIDLEALLDGFESVTRFSATVGEIRSGRQTQLL